MAVTDPAGVKVTPVMRQYLDIKAEHEDAVLLFRMGDFYEMFFEDAERAAEILDIALTSRNRNDPNPVPMCGVPFHSVRPYVARLLEAGLRVALCEQVDLPEPGQKLARRAVTRVVTPGTVVDDESLAPERSNTMASVAEGASGYGLALLEFSTGEARGCELPSVEALVEEIVAVGPSELVVAGSESLLGRLRTSLPDCLTDAIDGAGEETAKDAAASPETDGIDTSSLPSAARQAYANLFATLRRTQGEGTAHLRSPEPYSPEGRLRIDAATRRNLEILTSTSGQARGSLVSVLDRAVTAMGRRLIRRWLVEPLADASAIGARLDAVETLVEDVPLREELREALKRVGDLERTVGRVGSRSAGPRDLVRLADSLDAVAAVATMAAAASERLSGAGDLTAALASVDAVPSLRDRIRATLVDEPPAVANRGGVVRDGVHDEVDRLRAVRSDGKGWIAAFETEERERTGIPSLKVGFNKVFGFFIEVTKANQGRVPPNYTRKQTLANAERYITEDLKKRESEVLGAEERLATLEAHLFDELVVEAARLQTRIGATAAALARVDTLGGLAEVAARNGYTRPVLHGRADLVIEGGRHPVVEERTSGRFVSNECRLGGDHALVAVITGPNMAGKSTYLRQVALVALLAHCGSFVPAERAEIPLLDRIFTRIGASDDLSAGQSTFMVEMSETATILENMSDRSLVVLDEIGRGTSTFDGISIAWAVAEAMVRARVKTLFATHYHELAGLAATYPEAANFSVAVRRYRGEVIFLYRVVEGPTSGSYGIEVARLAGVPDAVIERAREMLGRFENGEGPPGSAAITQMSLFSPSANKESAAGREPDPLVGELAGVDVETLSPLEALNLLASLVARAKEAS